MFNIENMIPIFGSHTIVSKEELNNKDNIIKQLTSELVGYKKAYESLTDSNSRLDARFNNLTKKYETVCVENVGLSSEIKEANKNLIDIRKELDGKKTSSKTNRQKNQNSRTKNKKPVKKT